MKYGYARISTIDQNADMQLKALQRAGCKKIFTDWRTGATTKRPALTRCLKALKEGDSLTVWKLDPLARSLLSSRLACIAKRCCHSLSPPFFPGLSSGRQEFFRCQLPPVGFGLHFVPRASGRKSVALACIISYSLQWSTGGEKILLPPAS
jgi:hypothetical protein